LRYRLDYKVGPGRSAPRPDVAFPRQRVAVFVDGCFWHGCPEHGVRPRTNPSYWEPKIARNRARDARNDEELEAAGWIVVRVWEHEDADDAATRIVKVVKARRARTLS
jgi:DNA mismatch endonuclease (patch repair protein)